MRTALLLLAATVVFAGEEKKTPLERLAKTGVASPLVGYAGTPSEFSLVFRELRKADDDTLVKRLLADENPVFRCMGLNLLVDAGGKTAVRELRQRLGDRQAISLTVGCVMSTTTVAGIARRLLRQPRILGAGERDTPLLSADALLSLDLQILARDDTVSIHRDAARSVGPVVNSDSDDLPRLRERLPKESDIRIVKALGRAVDHCAIGPGNEALLVQIADDAGQTRDVRLAALAGLIHGSTEEAREAVKSHRALQKGTDLADKAARRKSLGTLLHAVFASGKTERAAEIESAPAVRKGDPAAILAFENVIHHARMNDRPVPAWVIPALDRVVTRAEAGFPAWDPDADLRYRLESFLWMEGRWLKERAASKALTAIEARIAKLVAE